MATNPIQWFPGHMAKTKRMMRECISDIDVIIELLDAIIPYSSKNPDIESIISGKPRVTVFTKATLANPAITKNGSSITKITVRPPSLSIRQRVKV